MKFERDAQVVLVRSGRRARVLEATDGPVVKVYVEDTATRLAVLMDHIRIIKGVPEPNNFIRTTPLKEYAGKHYRRRVEWEDGDLTEIADERMTSGSSTAKPMLDGSNVVCFSQDHIRWLHTSLGELIDHWDRKEEEEAARG